MTCFFLVHNFRRDGQYNETKVRKYIVLYFLRSFALHMNLGLSFHVYPACGIHNNTTSSVILHDFV